MKRILVPTDFSICADAAVATAMQLAKKVKAEILFMHILVTSIDWVKLNVHEEKRYPEVVKKISKAKSALKELERKAKYNGVSASSTLTFSLGTESIVEHSRSHDFDLIIMGSHGASGFHDAILGTNAQRLVQQALTPVMIVKNRVEISQIRNILFSSTFREDVHHPFHHVIELADLLNAHINLLYINDRKHFEFSKKSETRMKSFLEKCPRGTCSINVYNDRSSQDGILNFANEKNMDLIAIVTHGRSNIFKPSLTGRLVNQSELPVLSVNITL